MEMRSLGSTGISVSILGMGTVKWGRTQGLKYPNPVTLPTDEQLATLINTAQDVGINVIDCAPAYGMAEQRVGSLIPNRKDWVISTKFGERFEDGRSDFDFSVQSLQSTIDQSLRNLRTDYIDVLLVHSDGDIEHCFPEDLVAALQEEKRRGRVRAIGMSSKSEQGGRNSLSWADVLMVTLNPVYTEEIELIREAASKGVGIFVKKALISGHGGTQAHPSIRECLTCSLNCPGVSSVIIGSSSPANVQNNARIADDILHGTGGGVLESSS